jgi:LuxR family maltose regulon positive regulatory protein
MQAVSRQRPASLRLAPDPGAPPPEADRPAVLATKLFIPDQGRRAVARPRLNALLDSVPETRLTVLVAPAGWGKTTALAEWLRSQPMPCGWVSLDAGDGDLTRFWRYLLLAIEHAGSAAATDALRRLDAPGIDVAQEVLPVLVNGLAQHGGGLVLVLDDYHVISAAEVHRSLSLLLDRAPPPLHLVITSRVDPPLALSRLRVAGQLLDIRADQLRFTLHEAGHLLERASAGLPARQVERLVARTEGWAAGLQLAALRLADRSGPARADFVERFTGVDRHVIDYLGEEVLAGLTEELREFLLRTSVLRRICAPLAYAVTGRRDAAILLDRVEHANLFLVPLDEQGRWYRYHQLFRDLLRHELMRTGIDEPAELHRRAAEWYAAHDDAEESVEHAVESGDADLLARLVAGAWRREFNLGQLQTVQSWLDALPSEVVVGEPRLTVAQVWLHLDAGRLDEGDAVLRRAETVSPEDGHLRTLRSLHTYKAGDIPAAERLLAATIRDATDPFLNTVADLIRGMCALWSGRAVAAAQVLDRAAGRARQHDNRLARTFALGGAALAFVEAGNPVEAAALLRSADDELADGFAAAHFVAAFPALAAARLALAQGRPDDARGAAEAAVALARRGAGRVELAAALLTAAAVGDAQPLVAEARTVLRSCPDPGPTVRDWLARHERTSQASHAHRPVADELTDRERDILALLPGPQSQRELAEALFVSPNTMKTHLRAIYRKLGAESRTEAVLRARSLGLL